MGSTFDGLGSGPTHGPVGNGPGSVVVVVLNTTCEDCLAMLHVGVDETMVRHRSDEVELVG